MADDEDFRAILTALPPGLAEHFVANPVQNPAPETNDELPLLLALIGGEP